MSVPPPAFELASEPTSEPTSELFADDAAFVRAPPDLAYRRLIDIGRWPEWWAGVRVRSIPDARDGWLLEFAGARARRRRVEAVAGAWRQDLGFTLQVLGDVDGRIEFWFDPLPAGTVVHTLLAATTTLPRPDRLLADHRRAVRRGMWGLHDTLHTEMRTSIGLAP